MELLESENDISSNCLLLCNKMNDLYEKKLLSDISFSAYKKLNDKNENQLHFIPAHRAILAMGSPVFHAMFLGDLACSRENLNEADEIVHRHKLYLVIFVSDLTARGLDNLFRFIYSHAIELDDLPLVVIAETMMAAKKYLVTHLENLCWYYLSSIDTSYNPLDVLKVLGTIYSIHDEELIDVCLSVLDFNFEKIVDTQEFLHVEPEILIRIISRDSLISPEISIFRACLQWASVFELHNRTTEPLCYGMDMAFQLIKPYIRFQFMSFKELETYVRPSGILSFDEWFTLLACKELGKFHPRFLACPRHFYELWTINDIMNVYDLNSEVKEPEKCDDISIIGAIEFRANQRFALGGIRVFNAKECNESEISPVIPKLHILLDCVSRQEIIGEFELNVKSQLNSASINSIIGAKSTTDAFLPRAAVVCFPHLLYRLVISYTAPYPPNSRFTRCLKSWNTASHNFEIQFQCPRITTTESDSISNEYSFPYASFLCGMLFRTIG